MRNDALFRLIIVFLVLFCAPSLLAGGGGGVVLDGSFGHSGALPGPNFMIPASVGKQVGSNLFQSFSQFDLNNTQSATFTGPNNVQNILSRVTSGSASSIDGKVSSQIQGANLFFLNPAGVMFGPHAQLDVSGSVAVSTANYVKMVGGGRFNANLGGQDSLTSAPVSAFGFLNAAPAQVSFAQSNLNVATGKTFAILAGDVAVESASITGAASRVNLISVKSAGEAQFDATSLDSPLDLSQFSNLGNVTVNLSVIDTSGPAGGRVQISAGDLLLDQTSISSQTEGDFDGHGIDILAMGTLTLNNNSSITATTTGRGNSGNVTIAADTLQANNSFNALNTSTDGSGNGGNISVTAGSVTLDSARFLARTLGSGKGGTISVIANTLTLTGTAGEIQTSFDTDTFGRGMGGNINVIATSLILDRGAFKTDTIDVGKGGTINVTAESVSLDNNAAISAASGGSGDGGTVNILTDVLQLDSSVISTNAISTGSGGSVNVTAGKLQVTDRGRIASSTNASGNAGDVHVNATSMIIDGTGGKLGDTGIFARSPRAMAGSAGNGGSVVVTGNQLLLENRGAISASSSNAAPAGSVQLTLGTLTVESDSSISSANRGTGPAGGVIVSTSGPVTLKHNGNISTSSNQAKGGDITLSSDGIVKLKSQSSITASAGTDGGNVTITAPDLVYIADSSITATAGTNGGGTGGNITIDPRFIILRNSLIDASATGTGGNITLRSDFLFKENTSLNVTGTLSSGTVNITAPALDLGAQLITLPSSLVDAGTQLQERCTSLLQQDFSSFIVVGRGGTEPPPDEPQPAF